MKIAIYRLLRCNPFSAGGFDPVPSKGTLLFGKKTAGQQETKNRE